MQKHGTTQHPRHMRNFHYDTQAKIGSEEAYLPVPTQGRNVLNHYHFNWKRN